MTETTDEEQGHLSRVIHTLELSPDEASMYLRIDGATPWVLEGASISVPIREFKLKCDPLEAAISRAKFPVPPTWWPKGAVASDPAQHGRAGGRRRTPNADLQEAINRIAAELHTQNVPLTIGTLTTWFEQRRATSKCRPDEFAPYSFEPPIANCDELYVDGNKLVWTDRTGKEHDISLRTLETYLSRAKQELLRRAHR